MALPSRPLGGEPSKVAPVAPPLDSSDDFELPDLDFGAPAPAPKVEAPKLPEPDLSFDNLFNEPTPPVERASVAQFTEGFQAPIGQGGELPDVDFDSIFDEPEESETSSPLGEMPTNEWDNFDETPDEPATVIEPVEEPSLPEEDWDNFDALFDEPEEELAPLEESEPEPQLPEPAFDDLFEEKTEEKAEPKGEPSWDEDFDKFMEDDSDEKEDELPSELDDADEYVSTFDDEEEQQKPLKKNGGKKGKNNGRGIFGKFSRSLVNGLGSIPFIGKLFRPLAAIAGIFTFILFLIPLIAIPFIIYSIASAAVPSESTASGPDGAAITFSSFSYANGEVTGKLTNTGEVIANVIPTFTVWDYNPFGGGSLFAFDKITTCEGEEITADIDETVTVNFACESSPKGVATKTSAEAAF